MKKGGGAFILTSQSKITRRKGGTLVTSHTLGKGDKRTHQGRHATLMLLLLNLNNFYKRIVNLVIVVVVFLLCLPRDFKIYI